MRLTKELVESAKELSHDRGYVTEESVRRLSALIGGAEVDAEGSRGGGSGKKSRSGEASRG